jgi:hypothetical protein
VAGREIYGFPKVLGEVALPAVDEPIEGFALHATGIERFGSGARARRLELASVRPPAPPVTAAASCRDSRWDLDGPRALRDVVQALPPSIEAPGALASLAGVARRTGLVGNLSRLLGDLVAGQVGWVFLKQFRDVRTPERACYRSLVQAGTQLRHFRRGGLLPRPSEWQLALHDVDSAPFVRELGLAVDPSARDHTAHVRAQTAFWMQFSFEYLLGEELHRSQAELA